MTHNLVEQFRGKGPTNGGYVSGLSFKDLEGHDIVKWLRENGYEAQAVGGERFACGETVCGMRVYSNGYICDVDQEPEDTRTKAQTFEDEAAQHEQNAHDSFERCDTDGFLSQWASGISAELARAKAQIAEDHGLSLFERLYDVNENREINAKLIDGRHGAVWLVDGEDRHQFNGRKFIPFQGQDGRSRVQKQWGLEERFVEKPAHAVVKGRGRGLSGSAWVEVVEVDEVYDIYKEEA